MKNLFDNIKARLLAHESEMDLNREWAALEARRTRTQRKSRLRLAATLLLLLWIGGCGTWAWINKLKHQMATPAAQGEQTPVAVPAPSAPQPTGMASQPTVPTAAHQTTQIHHADHIDKTQEVQRPISRLHAAAKQSATSAVSELEMLPNALTPVVVANTSTTAPSTETENTPTNTLTAPLSGTSPTGQQQSIMPLSPRNMDLLPTPKTPAQLPAPYATAEVEQDKKTPATHRATWLYAGGGWLTTQQHFVVRDGQPAQAAALREQTEQPLPSFTFHAGIQRGIGAGRMIDLGFYYDQWYDHLDYSFQKQHHYTYSNVLLKVRRLDASGAEVKTYGDTTVVGTQQVHALFYNRYATFNLRLALVQRIWQNDRWGVAVGAGLNAQLWAQANGLVSAPDPVNGTYELSQIYKKSLGLGVTASTRLTYRLNDRYTVQVMPSATWGLTNALNNANPLEARLRQYSVTAGLMYRF